MNAENTTEAPAVCDSERAEESINRVSPDLIKESLKAYSEPVNEQISTLNQPLSQLMQENSGSNSPTAGNRTQQALSIRSPSKEAGTSRALATKTIASRGFPPNTTCPTPTACLMYKKYTYMHYINIEIVRKLLPSGFPTWPLSSGKKLNFFHSSHANFTSAQLMKI